MKEFRKMLLENTSMLRDLLKANKISREDFRIIKQTFPDDDQGRSKYRGWVGKIIASGERTIEQIESIETDITHWIQHTNTPAIDSDVYRFETYSDFEEELQRILSGDHPAFDDKFDTEDYTTIVNNRHVKIFRPITHQGSRLIGNRYFANTAIRGGNKNEVYFDGDHTPNAPFLKKRDRQCSWCTTYGNASNWDHYTNSRAYGEVRGITFYYTGAFSVEARQALLDAGFDRMYWSVAILVDGDDNFMFAESPLNTSSTQLKGDDIVRYIQVLEPFTGIKLT